MRSTGWGRGRGAPLNYFPSANLPSQEDKQAGGQDRGDGSQQCWGKAEYSLSSPGWLMVIKEMDLVKGEEMADV